MTEQAKVHYCDKRATALLRNSSSTALYADYFYASHGYFYISYTPDPDFLLSLMSDLGEESEGGDDCEGYLKVKTMGLSRLDTTHQ